MKRWRMVVAFYPDSFAQYNRLLPPLTCRLPDDWARFCFGSAIQRQMVCIARVRHVGKSPE
jgi:hypothetical protein